MSSTIRGWLAVAGACLFLQGCSRTAESAPKAKQQAAAKVENRVTEANLTKITLSPEAEQRLGIQLADVVETQVSDVSQISGEILLIPGKALTVTAPVAGMVHFARPSLAVGQTVRNAERLFQLTPVLSPQRDLRITYEADVRSAKARLDTATQQLERARQLLQELAGSQKNVEAADQEFRQAKTAHDAAVDRLERLKTHPLDGDVDMPIPAPTSGIVRQIQVSEDQTVASGALLLEVADFSRVWLRVPVYAGDLDAVSRQNSVRVRDVDGQGTIRLATRVAAPPTADPVASTADLYFELANADGQLRPGQRMSVILPMNTPARKRLAVPASAVLYDIHGGAWVYVNSAPHEYRRQRIEIVQTDGPRVILSRGPSVGAKVVSAGAAELFGTEFGAGK